jgi:hypothetical protein
LQSGESRRFLRGLLLRPAFGSTPEVIESIFGDFNGQT